MAFDLDAARKSGYSDAEIAQHLAQRWNFDLSKAKSSGYSDGEVISHLMTKTAPLTSAPIPTQPTPEQAAAGAVVPVAPPATRPIAPAGPPPSIGDRALGALETVGTVGTAMTTGALSAAAGGFQEVARQLLTGNFGTPAAAQAIEDAVTKGAAAGTYVPRTQVGQENLETLGGALQNLPPVAGVTGTLANAAAMAGPAAVQVGTAARAGARQAAEAARPIVAKAGEAIERLRGSAEEMRAAQGSVGAAAVDLSRLRQGLADELGLPPLLKGQASQSLKDQQEMHMLAKDAKYGEPIREALADQRQAVVAKMEEWIAGTGARAKDFRGAGEAIDAALQAEYKRRSDRVKIIYKQADSAGETSEPVSLQAMANYLNSSTKAEREINPALGFTEKMGLEIGAFERNAEGALVAKPIKLKEGELFRQAIRQNTNEADPRELRQRVRLQGAYDADTAEAGGALYKKARAAYRELSEMFEDHALTSQLMSTKRGTADRAIALENVVERMVFSSTFSRDQLQQTAQILKRSADGRQAMNELRGATLQRILNKTLSKTSADERRTPEWLPKQFAEQITELDRTGKLEYLFGKKGAEQLRTMNEVGAALFTPQKGSFNSSDTATVLAAMLDMAGGLMTGVPVPIATGLKLARDRSKDKQFKAAVQEQINYATRKGAKK